ncbi:MAG: HD domain-containing protein, partial [Treponemataceae bacterium]|nr:HD domain-containing protein [Treponemataceae bacterium]
MLYNILLGIQYASVVLMLFMCAYILKNWSKRLHSWFFLYCISTLINNAGFLFVMQAKTLEEATLLWKFTYMGRIWIPYSLFMFVLTLCKQKPKTLLMSILAVVHAATYLLVLTLDYNKLYYTSISFTQDGLFPHMLRTNGIWHLFYDLLIISYVVSGFTILFITMHKTKNKQKRKQLLFIAGSIFTDCIFYAIHLTHLIPGYDITTIGYAVASILFYIAIFAFEILDTKEIAKDFVIEQVSEGIIATTEDSSISFFNTKAKNILPELIKEPECALSQIRKLIKEERALEIGAKKYTPKENILLNNNQEAGKVYILSDDTKHYQYAEKLTREMMVALSNAVDAKDHYTNGHSERVARYSKEIAKRLGKSEEEQEQIYEMGLLHDIGKIGVSEDIINKTTRLTEEEFKQIKTHTNTG